MSGTTTTTTEVVEKTPSATLSYTKSWQIWSISNLQGFLPFLPKIPVQKESIGLLQRLSPRAIKSEFILTRRFPTVSSNLTTVPSSNQPTQTSVQTVRTGTSLSSPVISTSGERSEKNIAKSSIFSIPFANVALLTGLSNVCPEFLRRPHLNWRDKAFLTTLAVYSGLLVLFLEGSGCLLGLIAGSMPPGLVFMVGALFMMMGIACMTIGHDPNTPQHAILSATPVMSQRNLQRER